MDMPLAKWSEKLEFGLPMIDAQHRQLFELAASFAGNGDQIRVMKSLVMLCDYVKNHFRDEESMLEAVDYPDLLAHRQQHKAFRGMLLRLLDGARHLSLDEIAGEVEYLIFGWFYNHILEVDLAYVPWIKDHHRKTHD